MAVLTSASNPSFAMSPVAAAAGSQARAGEPDLVHGTEPKASTLSLEEAKRVILEATEKLWRGSRDAIPSLWQMLLNFFRWITRPFRDAMAPGSAPTGGAPAPGGRAATLDRNNVLSDSSRAQPEIPQDLGAPDDDFDMVDTADREPGPSPVKVPKLAFPKAFAASAPSDGGTLPLDAHTVQGALARLADKHPVVEGVAPQTLPVTAAVCLLEEYVSKVTHFQAQARSLEEQIQAKFESVASGHDAPADDLLQQVLAGGDVGGEDGAEIRRLAAERTDHQLKVTEFQIHIETALLNLKQQGLDVADIAERAHVADALPDWSARLDRVTVQEPPAPTPAERQVLAIEVEPEVELSPAGPSPERIARLRASMISNISNDEHEQERPRG